MSPAGGAQVNCYDGSVAQDGKRHGEGTFAYPNRFFKYVGEYQDGQKHGACVGRCPQARPLPPMAHRRKKLIGLWPSNPGTGKLYLGDGSCYEGDFHLDEMTVRGPTPLPLIRFVGMYFAS